MSSRAAILAAIRAARPTDNAPLPDPAEGLGNLIRAADLEERFTAAVVAAGGTCLRGSLAAAQYQADGEEGRVWSNLTSVPHDDERGPAAMADLALAIVHGSFGVAENGAIWVPIAPGQHRSHLFLAQRLLLLVDPADLVADMHAAYARLGATTLPPYGVFIAGPSKTADIEQTLVLGAHGPCELTVLLVSPLN